MPVLLLPGTRLLEKTLHECSKDSSIKEVYLHVQSNNEDAVQVSGTGCFW